MTGGTEMGLLNNYVQYRKSQERRSKKKAADERLRKQSQYLAAARCEETTLLALQTVEIRAATADLSATFAQLTAARSDWPVYDDLLPKVQHSQASLQEVLRSFDGELRMVHDQDCSNAVVAACELIVAIIEEVNPDDLEDWEFDLLTEALVDVKMVESDIYSLIIDADEGSASGNVHWEATVTSKMDEFKAKLNDYIATVEEYCRNDRGRLTEIIEFKESIAEAQAIVTEILSQR